MLKTCNHERVVYRNRSEAGTVCIIEECMDCGEEVSIIDDQQEVSQ